MHAQPPVQRGPVGLPAGDLSIEGTRRWTLTDVDPRADQIRYVRHQARLVLALWRLTDLTSPVEVLISELATNVVRHARTAFTVGITWDGRTLRAGVSDGLPLAPRPPLASRDDDEGGRGLLLVDAVATDWGVDLYHDGKTVWFEITRD
jgi:anti-sigma regulatory factor (Ser/Thr protein kinase)